ATCPYLVEASWGWSADASSACLGSTASRGRGVRAPSAKCQRGETCTLDRSVLNGACCCYTTRCLPRRMESAGGLVRLDPDWGVLETPVRGKSKRAGKPIAIPGERWRLAGAPAVLPRQFR